MKFLLKQSSDAKKETAVATVNVKNSNDTAKLNFDQISKVVNESEIGDQIILKGILSSIPKEVQEGKKFKTYQTALILPPREDGAIYSGILTLSSNNAIDVVSLNNYKVNSDILANIPLSENVPDSSSKSVIQQDDYIPTEIASIEEKGGDKYNLSIQFLGNAIQIQNPENESFKAVFTVKADILQPENINESN